MHNIPIDVDLANDGVGNSNFPAPDHESETPPKVRPKKFKYRVPLKLKKMKEGASDPHNESAEVEAILAGLEGDTMGGKERVMLQTGAYLEAARAINRCGCSDTVCSVFSVRGCVNPGSRLGFAVEESSRILLEKILHF